MGNVSRTSVPAVPTSHWVRDRWQVFPNHDQMGLAPTCFAEAD